MTSQWKETACAPSTSCQPGSRSSLAVAEGGGVGEPGFLPLGPLQAGQQVRRRVVGQVVLHQAVGKGAGPGVEVEQDAVHGTPQGRHLPRQRTR